MAKYIISTYFGLNFTSVTGPSTSKTYCKTGFKLLKCTRTSRNKKIWPNMLFQLNLD